MAITKAHMGSRWQIIPPDAREVAEIWPLVGSENAEPHDEANKVTVAQSRFRFASKRDSNLFAGVEIEARSMVVDLWVETFDQPYELKDGDWIVRGDGTRWTVESSSGEDMAQLIKARIELTHGEAPAP